MKRFFLIMACVAIFASCGSKTSESERFETKDTVSCDSVKVDTAKCDTASVGSVDKN